MEERANNIPAIPTASKSRAVLPSRTRGHQLVQSKAVALIEEFW